MNGGVTSLAYIGFTSPAADEWRTFGPDILGAELAPDGPDGAVRLRVDDAAHRISIHPGEANDLAYLGWKVDDLDAAIAAVEAAGASVHRESTPWFVDPFGFRHELVAELEAGAAFVPGRPMSGFVTGSAGVGHAVLMVPDLDAAERFYTAALGVRLSDTIEAGVSLRFFHCNPRHHSLALIGVPGMVGMHHLMLEVASLDDVGSALDVVLERGVPLAMTLGKHTNDHMVSFYVRTPSGFEIEYGTGGREIDDASWVVSAYDSPSIWGHRRPEAAAPPGIIRPAS